MLAPYESARILSLRKTNLPLIRLDANYLQPWHEDNLDWEYDDYNIFEKELNNSHMLGLRLEPWQAAHVFIVSHGEVSWKQFNSSNRRMICEIEELIQKSGFGRYSIAHGMSETQFFWLCEDNETFKFPPEYVNLIFKEFREFGFACKYEHREGKNYIPLPQHLWGDSNV